MVGCPQCNPQRIIPVKDPIPVVVLSGAYPRGTCRLCGGELATSSRSYCKKHKAERLKAWRLKRRGVLP